MSTRVVSFVISLLVLAATAPTAQAAVNVERQGAESPFIEVARSTLYGGLAGLVLGGALALLVEEGEPVKWGFIGGTFAGMGYGFYQVANRPKETALLEFQGATPSLHAVLPTAEPGRGVTMRLVAVRF